MDSLSDELLIRILADVAAQATCPRDFGNPMLTCRRFLHCMLDDLVLQVVADAVLAIPAAKWCKGAEEFLRKAANAGCTEAAYFLGMVLFYCDRVELRDAMRYLAQAAICGHPLALHSLAIILFNGSGMGPGEKNLEAGVALCERAALLGSTDALRDYGHCLQDGFGCKMDVETGRWVLLEANMREMVGFVVPPQPVMPASGGVSDLLKMVCIGGGFAVCGESSATEGGASTSATEGSSSVAPITTRGVVKEKDKGSGSSNRRGRRVAPSPYSVDWYLQRIYLNGHARNEPEVDSHCGASKEHELPDAVERATAEGVRVRRACLFGANCMYSQGRVPHAANQFLIDWFRMHALPPGCRQCLEKSCGRPETRAEEFWRCSSCSYASYCSRSCQTLDWRSRHRNECRPGARPQGRAQQQQQPGARVL
ncbi:hypothetical protein CBR_g48297 [Chara braunii]|uniref:MYND-type domain-containing protein n=1 Tax=Chara braunii TaxID=69332 RepID=A0A388K495_CHABU|nr:hypothetical protein CBR_g48297 [Chara braunii]|eukprot:GBG64829.1 hypothetical protein CBR_g48297 [Chara braunii]